VRRELSLSKEIITFITTSLAIILLILTAIPPATAVYLEVGIPSSTSITRGNTIIFHNVNLTIRGAERIPVEYLNFSIFRNSDDQCIAYVEFYINGSEKNDPLNRFSIQLVTPINFSDYWGGVTYGYDENTGWNETLTGYGYGYGNNSYGDLTILYNISYTTHVTGTFYARLYVNAFSHTYQSDKSVTFTVNSPPSGGGGAPSNSPPVADADGPYTGYINKAISFDGTGSYDPDGNIVNYTWNFGDGTKGYGETTTHIYTNPGIYQVTLTVKDNNGATNSDTTTVDITLDSDRDGWSDTEEELYGTDPNNPDDKPMDTDEDRVPDEYDENDDNDALNDEMEELIGSDPKDPSDVEAIANYWYIVDTNKDGIYDKFYDSSTGIITPAEIEENGEILLDTDGDGVVDHAYNPASGEIYVYEKTKAEVLPIIFIILGVIAVIILVILILFKMGYIYIEEEEE